MNNNKTELYKSIKDAEYKYTYFLLATAGAGIGFIFQKTAEETFSWWILPAGLAALSWGASFLCGCLFLRHFKTAAIINYQIIAPEEQEIPEEKIPEGKRHLSNHQDSFVKFSKWQFILLVLGAICLVSWRLAEMTQNYLQQQTSIKNQCLSI